MLPFRIYPTGCEGSLRVVVIPEDGDQPLSPPMGPIVPLLLWLTASLCHVSGSVIARGELFVDEDSAGTH